MEWVDNFLSLPSSFVFVQIDANFIQESLTNESIISQLEHFEQAKDSILNNNNLDDEIIQQQAEVLYGLIHQHYLNTIEGMEKMLLKQKNKEFPHCPRLFCNKTICVPYGLTDTLKDKTIKMFCPNCQEFYNVSDERIAKIDGAYFGPEWVELLASQHPELRLSDNPNYVPRIFGFRIFHKGDDKKPEEEKPPPK